MRVFLLVTASLALLIVAFAVSLPHADAAINSQINFQGKLTNTDGTNVTDNSYSITFSIYSVSTGGTAIWTETQSTVAVSNGIFQVNLGSVTALPGSVDFNTSSLYLGVKVGADAEMTPRIQFTATPYAFNSDKLGGRNSDQFVQLSPSAQQTGNVNINGSISAGSSLAFTAASTASIQSASAQSLNITGNAASTFSTSAGQLTLQSGSGTVSLGTSTALTATGGLAISSGGATSVTSATTNAVSLDSGTTGAVNIGTGANAKAITIGNTTAGTTITQKVGTGTTAFVIQGTTPATDTYLSIDSSLDRVYIGGSTAVATPTLLVLGLKSATGDPTGTNGSMYYNSSNNRFRCYEASAWKNCTNGAAYTFSTVPGSWAATATKPAAAAIIVTPLYVPAQITVNALRVNVTTALGATGDVGIYNSTGTLVLNGGSGTLTAATGLKTITPTQAAANRVLEPGQYYAAMTWNSATGIVSGANMSVAGAVNRSGTLATGGGLVLPATITLTSITNTQYLYAMSINN